MAKNNTRERMCGFKQGKSTKINDIGLWPNVILVLFDRH